MKSRFGRVFSLLALNQQLFAKRGGCPPRVDRETVWEWHAGPSLRARRGFSSNRKIFYMLYFVEIKM
ncbi:MAG TPA: hypothetical protein EYP74_02165 [Anaerolineales bacterium]|nr:hypothetical protein [Anaerolineales bacterium]